MRLHHETSKVPNVGKVASKDQSRPVLTQIHYDVDRGVVEATDSYKLVSLSVDVEPGDVTGFISPEAWTAFHKAHKRNAVGPAPSLSCSESELELAANGTRQTWPREKVGTFPNVPQLLPDEGNRSAFKVALNAKFLLELAQGLGADDDVVTLQFVRSSSELEESAEGCGYFPSNLRPLVVTSRQNGNGSVGILMPVRLP